MAAEAVVVVVGVGAGHVLGDGVRGEGWQAATGSVAGTEHLGIARSVESQVVVALDLRGGGCEEVDVHAGRGALGVARVRTQIGAHLVGVVGEGVRRRHVRRANLGNGSRAGDGLAWRGHHVGGVDHAGVLAGGSGGGGEVLGLVAAAGIGVIVNARVPSEFIGTAESLGAAGELAGVRLLAGVSSNVPRLVLQTVECTVAERTLVGPGQILAHLLGRRTSTLHERRQQADGRSHCRVT